MPIGADGITSKKNVIRIPTDRHIEIAEKFHILYQTLLTTRQNVVVVDKIMFPTLTLLNIVC